MYDTSKEKRAFEALSQDEMQSPAECAAYLRTLGDPKLYAVGETREHPIHSVDALPARWQGRENGDGFADTVRPGEYYAFQVGVVAHGVPLSDLRASWTDLEGPSAAIPAASMTCFQMEGVDCVGEAFTRRVDVAQDRVQPLWFGVDIPREAVGTYTGGVCVWAEGASPVTIRYTLEVAGEPISCHGDDEPWRHARLRWLNSKIAVDDEITAPFTPITHEDDEVRILGRRISLGGGGLPARIDSYFAPTVETTAREATPVLSAPIRFVVETDEGELSLCGAYEVERHEPGALRIRAQSGDGNLTLECRATLEYDGYMAYSITLSAKLPTRVRDVRLEIPLTQAASVYWMGMGKKGGLRGESLDWKWDATLNQDTLWMGGVNAGLMLRLKGTDYEKPYMLIYYHYHPLRVPDCWDNGGLGGCRMRETKEGAELCAYSGARELLPGAPITYLFDLTATPVKPINKAEHWDDHYYHHAPDDLKDVSRADANILNLHHANRYNPFINYPFFETDRLAALVDECHANSLRAKLYYTVKELTVRTPEFWAFRSLGDEIFPYTYEVGESFQGSIPYADEWLRTYVKEKYITAWRQRVNDGTDYVDEMEISLMVAPMSRWNNYFLEGLKWLLDKTGMDGLYFDDVAFDRSIMKRIRKILDRHHPRCTIDLHSWNYFSNNTVDDSRLAGWGNSMNLYIDNFAFIDRIWFGEGFDYTEPADYWLVEMSGIPFGMMGEMLQDGGNSYRGMLYGMTCRMPNKNDPRGVWRLWHDFRMSNATMLGFWNPACPVRTDHPDVLVTVYKRPEKALIAVASWAQEPVDVTLQIDYDALGLDAKRCRLVAPEVEAFQAGFTPGEGGALHIAPGGGCLLLLEETDHTCKEGSTI